MRKIRASGALFFSIRTNRVMLCLRSPLVSHSLKWGFVGGKIETGEDILEGLSRELTEEIGFVPEFLKVLPFDHFISDDARFEYSSILVVVEDEFKPILNHENIGYCWIEAPNWPKPLHPGARACLGNESLVKNLEKVKKTLS